MNIIKKSLGFIPILFCLLLVGCGGLPSETVKQVKEVLPQDIAAAKANVARQATNFEALKSSENWSFIEPYATKEKLTQNFERANASINNAQKRYDTDIAALLKKNDEADLTNLQLQMRNLQKQLKEAKDYASKAADRVNFLLDARKKAPEWVKLAQANLASTKASFNTVTSKANKAKKDYSQKSQDIDGRLAGIKKVIDASSSALTQAESQLKNVSSGNADYALLGDSTALVATQQKQVETMSKQLSSKLDELYRSYSKVLTDMKVEYFVEVGRSSWDNCCDGSSYTKSYTYPPSPVTETTFNYFDSLSEGTAASMRQGWGGKWSDTVNIDQNMWKTLKINMRASIPRGHDEGEFWINNYFANTYHKYLIVENGVKKETDWQKVPEDSYWKQEENLGLEITSKPYGMYEEEVLQSAAPPGMAYIAKPSVNNGQATGKNQYGEWKQDNSGTSFWEFYGQYAFISNLMGSNSYSYNEWDSYSRRDRNSAYYGANGGYGTYGHRTYNSSRYKNGGYAKRNPGVAKSARANKSASSRSKGGSKSQTASIRGSGPSGRGRGPSGGGK